MIHVRLRLIHFGNFNKSERTLLAEAQKANPTINIGPNECALLISKQENQLVFAWQPDTASARNRRGTEMGKTTEVFFSARIRIGGPGTWSPPMLAEYAQQVGIVVTNVRPYVEWYKAQRTVD